MSVNTPLTTLIAKYCVAACMAACSQVFATIACDPRKTGVTDYPFAMNIAAQIVDAQTSGSPAQDGYIFVLKNNGAEQRSLGLLSSLRTDITSNRRPNATIAPLSIAPGDKITTYIITNSKNGTAKSLDTLNLIVVTAPVQRNVNIAQRGGSVSLGGLGGLLRAR